ncbi:MAG: ribosome small subunit-dependent GTPase A [Saprospiraceae bacterium]|nr:ribosome small subunit-dependent GTPase A [Saprospiraceae bacterium]
MQGTVIKSTGSWYRVKSTTGEMYQCRIAGKLKLDDLKLTNPIAVGDIVNFDPEPEEEGIGSIKTIEPRKNYVVRQSPRKKHFLHFLASNIDQAVVVVTIKEPNLKPAFIDRFLLMTEPYNIPAVIVINKSDIYDQYDIDHFTLIRDVYTKIGYQVMLSSVVTGEGIIELWSVLKDKVTLICGQSGVGKSSLVNTIQPGLGLKTEEISDFSGKGQHTTTFAEMFELNDGGSIIDTPGIKTLAFTHLEITDVAHNFREFFALSSSCRFADCTHQNEPQCAIKKAVESGEISELRYYNYLNIVEEIDDQNYWERHSDV